MMHFRMRPFRTAALVSPFVLLSIGLSPRCASAQDMGDEPPFAEDDYAYTDSTMSVVVDVLANDYGVSAPIDPTSVTIIDPPATGTATVDPVTGEIEFTPVPGAAVIEYLAYEVYDQDGRVSNPAFLWIDVVHDPPVGYDDFTMTSYNESVDIDVLSNDFGGTAPIDPGTVTIVTAAADGSVAVDAATGEVTYTPDSLFSGSDWFEYVVSDSYGVESSAVRVDVDVVNLPPDIVWFDGWPDSYGNWVFEGEVQDENPESCTIEFGGIISGTTTPDATGYFEKAIYLPPGTSGLATATATDELGEQNTAETSVYGG